jgi:hypothetical protein
MVGGFHKSAPRIQPLRCQSLRSKIPPEHFLDLPGCRAAVLVGRRAERARRRADAGGIVLPGRYRRVAVRAAARGQLRFEEFDFSYYNRTPFAGLENDLANCYTNALLQVGRRGAFFCFYLSMLGVLSMPLHAGQAMGA